METCKLASAGDGICIWETYGFTLEKQLNPHRDTTLSLAWSRSEPFFCSASGDSDKVVLTYLNAAYHCSELTIGENISQVSLSSTSRYLAGGSPNGTVALWDLKAKKLRKSYKVLKSAITSIQFNWDDSVIAASDENGDIVLVTVSTGVATKPLVVSKQQAVRQLQYSYYKKSLLACSSDSGIVALWDTTTRQLVHKFDEHVVPSMGLAFSPVNETLLMSIGLDKKVVCYDTGSKRQVGVSTVDMPLTSIDIKNDGYTVVLGTTKGKLFIVDLRQGSSPTKVISAHSTSVKCVRFQGNHEPSKGLQRELQATKISKKGGTINGKENKAVTKNAPTTDGSSSQTSLASSCSSEGEGILLDVKTSGSNTTIISTRTPALEVISPLQNLNNNGIREYTIIEEKQDSVSNGVGVFSPLTADDARFPVDDNSLLSYKPSTVSYGNNNDIAISNSGIAPNRISAHSRKDRADKLQVNQILMSKSDINWTPGDKFLDLSEPAESQIDKNPITKRSSGKLADASSSSELQAVNSRGFSPQTKVNSSDPVLKTCSSQPKVNNELTCTAIASTNSYNNAGDFLVDPQSYGNNVLTSRYSTVSNILKSKTDQLVDDVSVSSDIIMLTNSEDKMNAFLQTASNASTNIKLSTPDGAKPSFVHISENKNDLTSLRSTEPLLLEHVRNIIQETNDELREEMSQHIFNLHADMIKQFIIFQSDVRSMLQEQFSVNASLRDENERLKAEIAHLKKTF